MVALLSIFLLIPLIYGAVNPGVRFTLDQAAIENFKNDYIQSYIKKCASYSVKQHLVTTSVFTYNVTNLHFSSFTLKPSNTQIVLNPKTNTINLAITNLSFVMNGNLTFWLLASSKGTVEISLTNGNFTIPLAVTVNSDGTLSAAVQTITGTLSAIKLKVHARNPIYKMMQLVGDIWPFKTNIASNFFSTMGQYLSPAIKTILAKISYVDSLNGANMTADYHFLNFGVSSSYIEGDLNGTCYLGPYIEPPYYATSPPSFQTTNTLKVQYSEYFFDTYIWGLQQSGQLNLYIPSAKAPSSLPFKMTTTGLASILPNIAKVYGQNIPIDTSCQVYNPPNIFMTDEVYITAPVYCDFLAMQSSTSHPAAFRLQFQLNSVLTATLNEEKTGLYLIPNVDSSSTTITNIVAQNSNIGIINISRVQMALNWCIYSIATYLNEQLTLSGGFKLPVPAGVTFTDEQIVAYPGAVEISGTPHFDMIVDEIVRNH
ncbi:unnamed protein product [Blepharisma stoltei]|uniref:Lipid-binding serum glycoprotein C-terminal domain-containing protein n=1 Tax=Blepharisma stoltei TaxID=1481888 RepID=A0AAU9IY13_9CILI|nr:unnamed protein product [Blepharisma stoltei]